jgi:mycothiol synthase
MAVFVMSGTVVVGKMDGSVADGGADVAAWLGAARLGGNWVGLLAAQAASSEAVNSHKMKSRRMALIIMRAPGRLDAAGAIPMTLPPFFVRLYDPNDFGAALAAVQASAASDEIPRMTAADFQNRLSLTTTEPGLDVADDMWVAVAPATGVVAYADGWLIGDDAAERAYRTDCWVQPGFRRQGIGRALLTRQWARAKYIAAFLSRRSARETTIRLRARAWDTQSGARALFVASSLQPVREYLEMRRELAARLPIAEPPPDVSIRLWSERRADQAIWAARNTGFAEHWGHHDETYQAFRQNIDARRIQPENSYIAWSGDVVAGACLGEFGPTAEERYGPGRGWVHLVFVLKPWRGRGLGRALLRSALLRAREMGHASVSLNVDAENATGAVSLYTGLGFETSTRRTLFERAHAAQPRPQTNG